MMIRSDKADKFAELVMKYTKRRKMDVICAMERLPGFKKTFTSNASSQRFFSHVEVYAYVKGWEDSDVHDGRPTKNIYALTVPYGSTPYILLYTQPPLPLLEAAFPEAIVRATMEE